MSATEVKLTIFWVASDVLYTEFLTKGLTVIYDRGAVQHLDHPSSASAESDRKETSFFCITTMQNRIASRFSAVSLSVVPKTEGDIERSTFLNGCESSGRRSDKERKSANSKDPHFDSRFSLVEHHKDSKSTRLLQRVGCRLRCLSHHLTIAQDYKVHYQQPLICTKKVQRVMIRFLFVESVKSAEIIYRLQAIRLSRSQVFEWIEPSSREKTSLCDNERSGSPSTSTTEDNMQALEGTDRQWTCLYPKSPRWRDPEARSDPVCCTPTTTREDERHIVQKV
ncbi:hypothetical protein TNCV_601021 [Trichonephila clavipes]|nr:hypothetical protein TNCV_601021 [Trichonephila clavipes]